MTGSGGVQDRRQRRREDLAAAVWRVLDGAGFAGLSIRAVAAEMGASTGVVTHHFATKRELTAFALELLAERGAIRARRSADPGLPALRAVLLDMLPLDAESRRANRIWVSSWDAALADTGHAADHAARYRASRDKVRGLVAAVVDDGRARTRAEMLHAAVLGLAVQAVLDPAAYPAGRLHTIVDEMLTQLLRPATSR